MDKPGDRSGNASRLATFDLGMTTVGIIGAGHIGSTLARGLVDRGYTVVISNSRGPESLAPLVAELGENASAATTAEAAASGDVVIVTVPLKAYQDVPVEPLKGKIVLDTNNYYWERDGHIAALDEKRATTTGLLQEHLPDSKVVKAFNHITSSQILRDGKPAGSADRRALATASDDPDAAAFVTALYDEFGFDTVDVGSVAESWRVERDQPAYVVRQTKPELEQNLARATR
ncbi:MAG: NADPH-dependent F420 reductase [Microbacterium sp.]